MSHSQPSIRNAIPAEFKRYLASRGIRLSRLASAAGLAPIDQDNPVQQLSLNATMALFDEAAKELKDPALGLNFARLLKPGASGLLGEIVITASTVREGLSSGAQFIRVFMSPFEIKFTEEQGVGRLDWSFPTLVTAPRIQYNMFMVAALLLRVRAATERDWVPLGVELEHTAPDCADEIRAVLGPRVRFNASGNCIVLDGPTLALSMPDANPTRFAIMRDLAERWLAEMNAPPEIVGSSRAAAASLLKAGQADLVGVATTLGISPGALQWRLERAGTTFEKVLAEERRTQAENLLRDTDRPLTEIAYDLGFSDPSAFTRAAQRWFGMSPRAWRRSQRQPQP